jgi:Ca2+-binding RTX toxin-like protein
MAIINVSASVTGAEFQVLVNTSAAGTILQLAAGTYNLDRTILIDRDDITIAGAGSGKTVIKVAKGLGAEAFNVGDGDRSGNFKLQSSVSEGGKVLTLTGAHTFKVNDYVYMARDSTAAFYDSIGDTTWRNLDVPLRTSIAKVVAVDGNKITLESGTHFDFAASETTVREIDLARNITLKGFSVDYGLGVADPSKFANTLSADDENAVIVVEGTAGLNISDITARNVPSMGISFALSTDINADRLTFTGAHNKGDGGNGYAYEIRDTYDSSFRNLTDMDMRHSVVFASWRSAVGNDVHVLSTDRDINFHGGRHHGNTVNVDRSIRDANSDIISPTLFVNTTGTHYGAPVDPNGNVVTFGVVVGSRLADKLTGFASASSLDGRAGNDSLKGGAAADTLTGGAGDDLLSGAAGRDLVSGGLDDDRIVGGLGKDTLAGNAGQDTFVFTRVADSAAGLADVISDFSRADDMLNLAAIDANLAKSGDQAFAWLGAKANSAVAGTLWQTGGFIRAEVDGKAGYDFEIAIGSLTLNATDFIL